MAGRCEGFYFFCDEYDEYVGFEVFWQQEGWFWRPLLTLDGEAVGPFTKSTEAYQTACRLLNFGDVLEQERPQEDASRTENRKKLERVQLQDRVARLGAPEFPKHKAGE